MVYDLRRSVPHLRASRELRWWPILSGALLAISALTPAAAAEAMLAPEDLESAEVAAALLSMARESAAATIAGRMPKFTTPLADLANASRNGVHVLLWRNGQPHGEGLARQSSLAGNIRVAAAAAAEKCDAAALADSILFLTIFGEEARPDCPPLPSRLRRALRVGEDGVRAEYRGLQAFIPPLTAIHEGWDVQELFEALAQRVAPPPDIPDIKVDKVAEKTRLLRVIADAGFRFFVAPAAIWASLPGDRLPLRIRRLGSLLRLEDVTAEAIRQSLVKAASWVEQYAADKRDLPGTCDLRQGKPSPATPRDKALMAAALGSAAQIAATGPKELGQRLLAKAMASYREDREGKMGFIAESDEVEIGAPAAALLALIKLDMAKSDQRASRLAAFLKGMRHPEGRFELFYPTREVAPAAVGYAAIADAQTALLAWAGLAADAELAQWLRQGLAYDCERLDRTQDLGLVPGLARVCALLGPKECGSAMIDLVLKASAILAATQQNRPATGEAFAADAMGCFVDRKGGGYEILEAGATARVVEGLAHAYGLAKASNDRRHQEMLRRAALLGARYLLQLQIRSPEDALLFAAPAAAVGAFRVSAERPWCRLSDQAACVAALAAILEIFSADDYRLPNVH